MAKKDKNINYRRLFYRGYNIDYDFTKFSSLGELFKEIYYGKILISTAEGEQDEFYYLLDDLKKYDPKDNKNISDKNTFLNNIQKFSDGREMIINAFKNKKIPLVDGSYSQYFKGESKEETDIYCVEKPEKFIKFTSDLKGLKQIFNVNFGKRGEKKNNKMLAHLR